MIMVVLNLSACAGLINQDSKPQVPDITKIESRLETTSHPIESKWWEAFGDPQLNRLIELGVGNSPSLKMANERVQVSQALLNSSRSVLLPQVGLTGQVNRQQLSENYIFIPGVMDRITNYGYVAGTFSWSLDLWGKNEKLFEASKSRLKGALLDGEMSRLNLQIAIVAAYAEFDIALKSRDLMKRANIIQQELLDIYKVRQQNGLIDNLAVEQMAIEVEKSSAQLAMAQSVVDMYATQLAILTGNSPSWAVNINTPNIRIPEKSFVLNQQIPSDLIARRPDLQVLLSQIDASGLEYSASKLDYLPSFDLQASVGYQSFGLDRFISSSSQFFSIGPVFNLPIFNGGRIDANVAAKKATNNEAIARYHEALLQALKQSADGITKVKFATQQLHFQKQATEKSLFIYDQLASRKKNGLISNEKLLQNELLLISQKQLLEQTNLNAESSYLYLIQALGGGFSSPIQE
jgi:NodT family efflux transporter outer membrane factor (OMF) lipoprotein